jgi:ABC-type Fe3+/spermidine/putrescine transport system ATPase subunit
MARVEVARASKRYGPVAALDEVSLDLAEGELFGLLGPSGSGKTTLLRAVAGFVALDAGRIAIDGQDLDRVPVHAREIGMVFQSYALFPHMSVFDNVAFGLAVKRVAAAEVRQRVGRILELVRLSGLEARRPRQLSGGQQQRVALARALVTRPRVLLLDEPLAALDKGLRQAMQVELRQIQREVGITTIFVTHDQEEALTLSDRVAIFQDGRVVQTGTPRALYDRPATRFAATFLGAANMLEGRIAALDGGCARIALEGGGEVTAPAGGRAPGARVALALRPERARLGGGGETRDNRIAARVEAVAFSGSSVTYRLSGAGTSLLVSEPNRGQAALEAGAAATVRWAPEQGVLLDD